MARAAVNMTARDQKKRLKSPGLLNFYSCYPFKTEISFVFSCSITVKHSKEKVERVDKANYKDIKKLSHDRLKEN